jgi:glyoxylase-like metal-dependent hydrolase (beta-lactamase superfamily II)
MSVGPAKLPLAGGEPGATVALHPICCAEVAMTEGWVHANGGGLSAALDALGLKGPGRRNIKAPIVAFLIEHPTAGPLLVDTGFPADVATAKRDALGALNSLIFRGVRMSPEGTVAEQVAARGVPPEELSLIVMTHLHADHASALRDFPNATVIVTEDEWKAATARDSAFAGYHRDHLDPRLEYRLLRFPDQEKELDLFGDGSIRLLSTPGHTPGHVSVVTRLRDRDALIAGDAIYTLATLRDGKRPYRTIDRKAFERSIERLAAFDRAHPGALVIPGHDMEAWEALEPSYR